MTKSSESTSKMSHPRIHATENPNKPAIIMAESGVTLTYAELSSRSNQCTHLVHSLGVSAGDHIALLLENRPEYFEIAWAAINAGISFTPISTHLAEDEIAYIVNDCGAQVVFVGDSIRADHSDLTDRFPDETTVITMDRYEALLAEQPDSPDDGAVRGGPMMYSSGTTGRPKGIVLPDGDAKPLEPTGLTSLLETLYGFDADTVYLSPAPLYHTAPLKFNLAVHSAGGTSVICSAFDAEESLAHVETWSITHSQWVPTMLIRLLSLPEETRNKYSLGNHKVAIHAAAPCPAHIKQEIIDWWGPILYEYYGGTESAGFTSLSPEEFAEKPGSVGKSLKGTIRILDDDENELPTGDIGTIYFEDGGTFHYHNDPEKTASAHSNQGWNTMGDVGYVDDDGFLYLTDRKHDMIISGGVNIYPQEIEHLLLSHPLVVDVAVFGIPNDDFGEEVKACVQLVSPSDAGPALEQALQDFCRQQLSRLKCPRSIDFVDSLPRQPNGKLYKRQLKVRYWPN